MLMQQTLSQLKALKLDGMARAFEEQAALTASTSLSFEDRFGMVVERELAWRDTRRLERLLKSAKLKNPQACIEDIEYKQSRGLDKSVVATLASCDWIRNAQNIILTGATGAGKTWIACAFGQQACRQGFSVLYVRVARLFEELKIAHGDGSFTRRLAQLAKVDVLLLDDWGLQDVDPGSRNDLLEVLDDRVGTRSTIITSQLPQDHWHAWLQDPTLADAILDRLVHQAHKLPLKGESMRKPKGDDEKVT
ncbi:IS21-like element helper ATPase IstB [Burkholderia ubonensis]|uniref:IS21-like element helper ATPase IstB n=1 Tax=Burkholderia ubonensis TaxID=101571 RepID=UPI00075BD5EB|nr:IS21-like element helper ATPase IstB [Burkholderia ubonensis]KVO94018.1 AAA family ATPase [Burkholderia ubonensis]